MSAQTVILNLQERLILMYSDVRIVQKIPWKLRAAILQLKSLMKYQNTILSKGQNLNAVS